MNSGSKPHARSMQEPPPADAVQGPSRLPAAVLALTAVAALATGATVTWMAKPGGRPIPGQTARFVAELPHPVDDSGTPHIPVALSPDGSQMVVSLRGPDGTHLYLRDLDDFEVTLLPGTENGRSPMFSPDGRSIVFTADRAMRRLSVQGGRPITLTEFGGIFFGGTWISNDELVVITTTNVTPMILNAETGAMTEVPVAEEHRMTLRYAWPQSLGDHWILCALSQGPETDTFVGALNLTTGEERRIVRGSSGRYLSSGHLLFGV